MPSDIGVEDCIDDLLYDHAATLKRLDITQDYFQKRQPLVSYRLGGIASFSVLSEITIDYRMVQSQLNRDARAGFPIHLILPPSLVLLTIRLGGSRALDPARLPGEDVHASMLGAGKDTLPVTGGTSRQYSRISSRTHSMVRGRGIQSLWDIPQPVLIVHETETRFQRLDLATNSSAVIGIPPVDN